MLAHVRWSAEAVSLTVWGWDAAHAGALLMVAGGVALIAAVRGKRLGSNRARRAAAAVLGLALPIFGQ